MSAEFHIVKDDFMRIFIAVESPAHSSNQPFTSAIGHISIEAKPRVAHQHPEAQAAIDANAVLQDEAKPPQIAAPKSSLAAFPTAETEVSDRSADREPSAQEAKMSSKPTAEALAEGLSAAVSSPNSQDAGLQNLSTDAEREAPNTEELKPQPAIQNHPLAEELQGTKEELKTQSSLQEAHKKSKGR